jgi:endo-1,4-beta-xylanase
MELARRSLIALTTGTLGLGLLAGAAAASRPAAAAPSASPAPAAAAAVSRAVPDPTTATLRQLARHTKLEIGTAVDTTALRNDATYRRLVATEFSSVTPENVMKWEVVHPERGRYDFSEADQLVAFARQHGQKVRGHTLLWHNQLPAWLTSGTWTRQQLRSILREHILTVAGHFRGRVWAWDVVNEAFNEDGTLRDTIWLRTIGPEYIADAFRWAHQADPRAVLFYNDYNVEGINAKSTAAYNLLRQLRRQGVPVEGFGAQGHLSTQYPFPQDVLQNLRRFGRLGLQTAITEADVRHVLPADPAEVNAQAEGYSLMLESCLLERSCVSYTVWGFTDRYQWVPQTFPGEGEAAIFDANYNPKPAYNSMRRDLALAGNPGRRG